MSNDRSMSAYVISACSTWVPEGCDCERLCTLQIHALTHSLHPQTPFDVQLKGATGFSISGTHYVRQRFQAVSDNRSDHPPRRQLAKSATASAGEAAKNTCIGRLSL